MKKLVIIIPIFILLIITSFLIVQNNNLKKEIVILNNKISDLEKQKSVSPELTPIAEKSPEGWKEYIDEEYKFKIWYPEKFIDYTETNNVIVKKYKFNDNKDVSFFVPYSSDMLILLDIYIYIYTNNDLEQIILNDAKYLRKSIDEFNKYKSEVSINNQEFIKFNIPGNIRAYLKNNS